MRRHWLRKVVLVAVLVLATACGSTGHHKQATSPPSKSSSPQPSDAPPSPSPTAAEQQFSPGDVVMSSSDIDAICAQATGTDTSTEDSSGDAEGDGTTDDSQSNSRVEQILPGGTVLIECSTGDSSTLAAVDARADSLLWQHDLDTSTDDGNDVTQGVLKGGNKNVYMVTATDHPAEDLSAERITRTVEAIDASTGQTQWTKPLDPNETDENTVEGTVDEGPSEDGKSTIAVVDVGDYSAFASADGTPLWRVPQLDPKNTLDGVAYAGFGRSIGTVTNNDETVSLVGTDVGSGKIAWTTPSTSNDPTDGADSGVLSGSSYWFIGDQGYDAYNIQTGAHIAHGFFPTAFTAHVATPTYTVAQVGKTLRAFHTGDWGHLLWSVPSDSAQPSLVTHSAVVVTADSGNLLLSMTDGSVIDNDFAYTPRPEEVVDGLYATEDGDIIEMGAVK